MSKDDLSRFERAIAYICHELRNPLHVIAGVLYQLDSGVLDAAAAAVEMSSLRACVGLMVDVTNDLLDLTALWQGKLRITRALASVRELVRVCTEHPLTATAARVTVEVSEDVPAMLLIDALRVKQILMNGLTNAAKCVIAQ